MKTVRAHGAMFSEAPPLTSVPDPAGVGTRFLVSAASQKNESAAGARLAGSL